MNEMNFALKLRKIYLISILTVLTVSYLNAQQFSFEKNNHIFSIIRYTFPSHLGIEKTYSLSQNNLGVLFFSTNKGILSFDGQDWGVVNFNKKSILLQHSGRLILFANNFTGEIRKDASGAHSIAEIRSSFPVKNWTPHDAIASGDSAFIIANKHLWIYRNNSFHHLADSIEDNAYLYAREGKIYLIKPTKVFLIQQGRLIPSVLNTTLTKNSRFLNGNTFFSALTVNNELILKSNRLESNYIKLPINDKIAVTYPDKNRNLWLLSESALFCIKYAEYFRSLENILTPNDSLTGLTQDSSGYYLASTYNIYSTQKKVSTGKNPIKNIYGLENKILISRKDGIYNFEGGKLLPVVSRPISYTTKYRNKLLFISRGYLCSLRFNKGTVSVKEIFNLKTDSILKISFSDNQDLLLLDKNSKILRLKSNSKGITLETLFSGKNNNTQFLDNIFQISGEIYVSNTFNIYKLEGNRLVNQEKSRINFPSQGHFIEYLAEDTTGGILYSIVKPGENKHIYYGKNIENKDINWFEIPIWEAGLKNPDIISYSGREIWFLEEKKLIHLNLDNFFGFQDKLIISTHEVLADNQVISLQSRKRGNKYLPYFEAQYPINLVSLKFYASDLNYPGHIRYSYLLKDEDATWSEWSQLPERNFSNLPPGEYQLFVKAQTLNGSLSDTFSILFHIRSPFYLQWYAWVFYALVFTGIIGIIGLQRKMKFEKEKIKLERIIQERTSELMREKEKTDELLANMLPKDTADELKNTGKATSHKFDMATVLFSDIQGFTKIAEQMNPEKLIDELDNFFFQFDSVVEKYNIEKIKTIGDAYMAAGGIPYKNRTNPVEVVLAALEMQEYMKTLRKKNTDIWDLRIGVHTGAVIAGVIGHKRISYDIWGDTVNTASRMESSGEAGKINISGQTYEMVKEFFICEYRGRMPVKYKGDVDMYFVKGIRPELSVNLRTIPNKKFFVQLQLLRIHDLEEFVFDKLAAELSPQLLFHNLKHTKDVYTQVELLGRAENVNPEEMLFLRSAALFHDTGYIWVYHNHESKSIEFCKDILPKFKYSEDQIETICELITCTRFNARPQNKLEKILIDAITDYYGRIDFLPMLLNLAKELKINYNRNEDEMILEQISILEKHEYYTNTSRKLCEVPKGEQLKKIRRFLAERK
jgi:class 3 adenylate cyclase/HD superfamily phosphodiesterase